MSIDPAISTRAACNGARWRASSAQGHYESWFVRANHPREPLALWIRYTLFSPLGRPHEAIGELWAMVFDGDRVVACRSEHPIAACRVRDDGLAIELPGARLEDGALHGTLEHGGHRVTWSLTYDGGDAPLLLLPPARYRGGFPKAKTLVPAPMVRLGGTIDVDGDTHVVDRWLGSQNHNWGTRHTDRYAWAQVAGFDDRDDAFLECASAKLRLGPLWTPWLTVAVLRIGGHEHRFNALSRAPFADVTIDGLSWRFTTHNDDARLNVALTAPRASFVGLRYRNPPGGDKICLNSKLARCELELLPRDGAAQRLVTEHRAAFELLGDDAQGVPVVA
jgi:hypothetical protein